MLTALENRHFYSRPRLGLNWSSGGWDWGAEPTGLPCNLVVIRNDKLAAARVFVSVLSSVSSMTNPRQPWMRPDEIEQRPEMTLLLPLDKILASADGTTRPNDGSSMFWESSSRICPGVIRCRADRSTAVTSRCRASDKRMKGNKRSAVRAFSKDGQSSKGELRRP